MPRGQPIVCVRNRRPWYGFTRGGGSSLRVPAIRLSLPQRPAPPAGFALVLPIHPMRGIAGPGRLPVRLLLSLGPALPAPARPLVTSIRRPATSLTPRYSFGITLFVAPRPPSRSLVLLPRPRNSTPATGTPRRSLQLAAARQTTFNLQAARDVLFNLAAARDTSFNLQASP